MSRQRTREEHRAALLKWSKNNQHMLDLDDAYPEVEMFGPQSIGAEVGPGWKDILIPCLEVLRANGCKVGQIKQKFGGLRIYWDYPDHIEKVRSEWRKNMQPHKSGMVYERIPLEDESDEVDVNVGPVITRAETLSFRTCESCGADICREGGPCHRTQCQDCKTRKA